VLAVNVINPALAPLGAAAALNEISLEKTNISPEVLIERLLPARRLDVAPQLVEAVCRMEVVDPLLAMGPRVIPGSVGELPRTAVNYGYSRDHRETGSVRSLAFLANIAAPSIMALWTDS
jgi:hypothetical protein